MKHSLKSLSVFICLLIALSGCDDKYLFNDQTREDEYDVTYSVRYSTIHNFHNIVHISYYEFYDYVTEKTSKIPTQVDNIIDGTEAYYLVKRVPKGAHLQLSTFVDADEVLSNTKVKISIKISALGGDSPYTEVATAEADCPLKDNPLTISYTVPD